MYLFVSTLVLITILTFWMVQLFRLEMKMQDVTMTKDSLQSEIQKFESKRSTKNRLKKYPSSGVGLEKSLAMEDQTINSKGQIEKSVAEKLEPYIEEANLIISDGDDSDTVSILLTGSFEATNVNLVIFGQNISEMMREVEGIKTVSEVHVHVNDREENELYKGTYVRDDKGQFIFQSEMRKGKG